MNDKNEFGRNTVKKTDKRLKLGKITLEFGSCGSLTDGDIDQFFTSIKAVKVITVKGFVTDMSKNLKYVADKLRKYNIDCAEIRVKITV